MALYINDLCVDCLCQADFIGQFDPGQTCIESQALVGQAGTGSGQGGQVNMRRQQHPVDSSVQGWSGLQEGQPGARQNVEAPC